MCICQQRASKALRRNLALPKTTRSVLTALMLIALLIAFICGAAVLSAGRTGVAHASGQPLAAEPQLPRPEYMRAVVLEIGPMVEEDMGYGMIFRTQLVKLRVTAGPRKGMMIELDHSNINEPGYEMTVEVGRRMLVSAVFDGAQATDIFIEDYARDGYLSWLAAAFVGALVLVGGKKGFKTAFTLGITALAVVKVLLPLLLAGYSPVPVSVAVAAGVTAVTLVAVAGFSRKTLAAIIGTTGGVVTAGLLATYVGRLAHLTGLSADEARMLLYIPQGTNFDYRGLLFGGILIGALGAVMDVGMSIASAVDEVYRVNPALSPRALFASGMNVGRDVMGTMANTLILAYAGGAIPLLLLFMAYQLPVVRLINLDLVATEVVRALTGSIGLVLAIPITAAAGSALTAAQGRGAKEAGLGAQVVAGAAKEGS